MDTRVYCIRSVPFPQWKGFLSSLFHMIHAKRLKQALSVPFVAGLVLGIAGTSAATVLGSSVFPDVQYGMYYDAAIGEMYSDGIITGYESGKFGPDDNVTRGQLALMLSRFKKELQGTVASSSSSRNNSSSSSSSQSSASSVSSNAKGVFRFTSATFSIPESTPSLTVSVLRTGGTQGDVTVDYAVTGGTATVDSDFLQASGKITFESGDTSKTIVVKLKEDTASEGSETVNITLSNPGGGASLGTPSSAVLTILDNEASNGSSTSSSSTAGGSSSVNSNGTMSFTAAGYAVAENGGSLTITVGRTGGSNNSVAVNYATSNGSGNSGSEYTATSGTLNFNAGETTKSFTVPVNDDSANDGSKTFNVTLSSPAGGANLGSTSTAVVTILDNETVSFGSGSLKFSKSTYSVTETSGTAVVTVLRTGGAQGTISINYSTVGNSAASGVDFTPVSGTLTFAPNESSKNISIPLIKDTNSDPGETFLVDLSGPNPSAIPLLDPYSATVSIE